MQMCDPRSMTFRSNQCKMAAPTDDIDDSTEQWIDTLSSELREYFFYFMLENERSVTHTHLL